MAVRSTCRDCYNYVQSDYWSIKCVFVNLLHRTGYYPSNKTVLCKMEIYRHGGGQIGSTHLMRCRYFLKLDCPMASSLPSYHMVVSEELHCKHCIPFNTIPLATSTISLRTDCKSSLNVSKGMDHRKLSVTRIPYGVSSLNEIVLSTVVPSCVLAPQGSKLLVGICMAPHRSISFISRRSP